MKHLRALVLCLPFLFLGCTALFYPDLDSMIVSEQEPKWEFEIIGTVAGSDEEYNDLIETLKIQAVKLGGDALWIRFQQISQIPGDDQYVNIRADVVKYVR